MAINFYKESHFTTYLFKHKLQHAETFNGWNEGFVKKQAVILPQSRVPNRIF